MDDRKEYRRMLYLNELAMIKESNRCYTCKRTNDSRNRLRCIQCSRALSRKKTIKNKELKTLGLCLRCRTKVEDSRFSRCNDCRKLLAIKDKEYRKRRKEYDKARNQT